MLNDFLARLDNDPTAPVDFVWPSFSAVNRTGSKAIVAGLLLPSTFAREWRFRRAVRLMLLVGASALSDRLTAQDSRLAWTPEQLRARVQSSATKATYTGSAVLGTAPTIQRPSVWFGYTSTTVQMVSASSVVITPAGGTPSTVTLAFTGGMSQPLVLDDRGLTCTVPATWTVGTAWLISGWSEPDWLPTLDSLLRAAVAVEEMPSDLRTIFTTSTDAIDRIAAVVVWLTQ